MSTKEKSLLEIAIELMGKSKKPLTLVELGRIVAQEKGLKNNSAIEVMPQFFCDVMTSGYFVYCGEDLWDLKERQPLSVVEKDMSDFDIGSEEDREAERNKLGTPEEIEQTAPDESTEDSDDIKDMINQDKSITTLEDEGVQLGYETSDEDEDEDDFGAKEEEAEEEPTDEDELADEIIAEIEKNKKGQ